MADACKACRGLVHPNALARTPQLLPPLMSTAIQVRHFDLDTTSTLHLDNIGRGKWWCARRKFPLAATDRLTILGTLDANGGRCVIVVTVCGPGPGSTAHGRLLPGWSSMPRGVDEAKFNHSPRAPLQHQANPGQEVVGARPPFLTGESTPTNLQDEAPRPGGAGVSGQPVIITVPGYSR
jgi:hypothetical protein